MLCDLGETGDGEVHFVFYCSFNNDLGGSLFSKMTFVSDEFFCLSDYKVLCGASGGEAIVWLILFVDLRAG